MSARPDRTEPPPEETAAWARPPAPPASPNWPDRSHFSEFDLAIEAMLDEPDAAAGDEGEAEAASPSEAPGR